MHKTEQKTNLSDFITQEAIIGDLKGGTANEVLAEMLDSLIDAGKVKKENRTALLRSLIARERKGTTGFGGGVAIPHIKHGSIKDFVCTVARSKAGVDFAALDQRPVNVFFMLLSPLDEALAHLKAMEHIFRTIKDQTWCRFVKLAKDKAEIIELLNEADEETSD